LFCDLDENLIELMKNCTGNKTSKIDIFKHILPYSYFYAESLISLLFIISIFVAELCFSLLPQANPEKLFLD
jgi:hypothetical protein